MSVPQVELLGAVPSRGGATRVMPFGDSITGEPGCWRAMLWKMLRDNGYRDIDFVGTRPARRECAGNHDGDNEGHGGFQANRVAREKLLTGWLAVSRPDVVLMHFGTNDVWHSVPTATILDAFDTLLRQMRVSNPDMTVVVAQIIPMGTGCCPDGVLALNQALPAWVAARTTQRSPVLLVDQWTGFDPAADTHDGVHPNAFGDGKIAARWYPVLASVLSKR
ncbi:lysophospholipase L1-like esterase [Crossiella equi]|uniref:Lysophospholipase L1-like esterase n=1 Tax=Crossiella equi TaxID=130796 RepID=A0ABS5A6L5_9PSEU|nr:SGNH/GDSL hydrolase family protein [Crossiella equi]MBP2472235.1 lysophospholipase L1-like esterase [Crossiella equi]